MNPEKWLMSEYVSRELFIFKRMIIELVINDEKKKVDLTRPIDLSLTSKVKNSFKAWYVDEIQINVIKNDDFVGSVKQGGVLILKNYLLILMAT